MIKYRENENEIDLLNSSCNEKLRSLKEMIDRFENRFDKIESFELLI